MLRRGSVPCVTAPHHSANGPHHITHHPSHRLTDKGAHRHAHPKPQCGTHPSPHDRTYQSQASVTIQRLPFCLVCHAVQLSEYTTSLHPDPCTRMLLTHLM
jgi:hypothetical protein